MQTVKTRTRTKEKQVPRKDERHGGISELKGDCLYNNRAWMSVGNDAQATNTGRLTRRKTLYAVA